MGSADVMVLVLLALADLRFLLHLRRRRERQTRSDRMMRSLRIAVQREVGIPDAPVDVSAALVLQRAS
jgi:hypothetical protein